MNKLSEPMTRLVRLCFAEWLIGKVMFILPPGPERTEFCQFVVACWISRLRTERTGT